MACTTDFNENILKNLYETKMYTDLSLLLLPLSIEEYVKRKRFYIYMKCPGKSNIHCVAVMN